MDISLLCRSCMKELPSCESENFNEVAVQMFCYCTDIKIFKDDRLPKQFCIDCHTQIDSSYKFITQAQKVNIALITTLSRIDNNVINNTDKFECDVKKENDIDTTETNDSDNLFNEAIAEDEPTENSTKSLNKYSDVLQIETRQQQELEISKDIKEKYSKYTRRLNKKKMKTENCCPICLKMFKSKAWLSKHISKVHMTNLYFCKKCPEAFSKECDLESHSAVHASPTQRLSCAACSATFASHRQLTSHAQTHDNASASRPYTCDYCASSFKAKHHLRTHISNLHTKAKRYLCNICAASFSQLGNLKGHIATHSTAKPYRCQQCAFATNSAYLLNRHRRRHDKAAYTHRCPHCSKTFGDSAGLVRHIRRHTGARPYKCSHCSQAFIDSWKRKVHLMRSHKMLLSELHRLPIDPGLSAT